MYGELAVHTLDFGANLEWEHSVSLMSLTSSKVRSVFSLACNENCVDFENMLIQGLWHPFLVKF